jgi:PST family polysaccharide transporter
MANRLLHNTILLGLVQISNYIAPLVVLTYLTRRLGVEIFGVLAFSQGLLALSLVLIDFGFELSVTAKVSTNSNRKIYISRLLSTVTAIKLIIFIFVAIIISIYAHNTEKYKEYSVVFYLSIIPLFAQSFLPTWLFQGIEKMKFIALILTLTKFIYIFSIVIFVKQPSDYYIVPVVNGIAQVVALFVSIYLVYRLGFRFSMPKVRDFFYCIKITKHFFASRLAVASYMTAAPVVLGLVGSPASVAIYSIAEQLYRAMQAAFLPIVSAAYPYMAKEKNIKLMLKIAALCLLLAVVGAITGYFIGPYLILVLFHPSWIESISVLNVFFFAIVVHVGAVFLGYPLAAAVGRLSVANTSVIFGSIVYFILLLIALKLQLATPISFAVIMVISEFTVFFYRAIILIPTAVKLNRQAADIKNQ